ncbi:MAG: class I SAM-dependent methyltransferase [Gemmatales bacterium]|nr:class I SAM-dependent methyltransferase [Gemmatales bacterium]MDW7993679.1 class I SAM-dependent methyltransferase [Gemmatales bacterium]
MTQTETGTLKRRRLWSRFNRWLESKLLERVDPVRYNQLVRATYDGPAGWFTLITGYLTGHEPLAKRLIGPRGFDIRGCKWILDAGTGNGRYLRILLRRADPDAVVVGCDLSLGMLRRARKRLKDCPVLLAQADVNRLPYPDECFDAIVFGWVLEHLPNPLQGLRELARVLRPEGKILLMTTEDNTLGAITSRVYHCRATNRRQLREWCRQAGLIWYRELWWSRLHRALKLGGILVELRRAPRQQGAKHES